MHICIHLIHPMSIWCRRTSHFFLQIHQQTLWVSKTQQFWDLQLLYHAKQGHVRIGSDMSESVFSCLMHLYTCPSKQALLVWLQKNVGVIVLLCMCRSNWLTWISLPVSRCLFQKVTGVSFTPLTLRSLHLSLSLLFGHDADCMSHLLDVASRL